MADTTDLRSVEETHVGSSPTSPIKGGNMKITVGEVIPKGYGIAIRYYDRDEALCLPIPFHILYRWGYSLYWWLVNPWKKLNKYEEHLLLKGTQEKLKQSMEEVQKQADLLFRLRQHISWNKNLRLWVILDTAVLLENDPQVKEFLKVDSCQ